MRTVRHIIATVSVLTVYLFLHGSIANGQDGNNPVASGMQLDGWLVLQEAKSLEKDERYTAAHAKYIEAKKIFDKLARKHPNWKSYMVSKKRQLIEERLLELRDYASPTTHTNKPTNNNDLNTKIDHLTNQKNDLVRNLRKSERELQSTQNELDKIKADQNSLLRRLENLERNNSGAGNSNRNNQTQPEQRQQIVSLTKELAKAATAMADANKRTETLLLELKAAKTQITDLENERTRLIESLRQNYKNTDGGDNSVTVLIDENERLRQDLATAQESIDALSRDNFKKDEMIKTLRSEVATLNDELNRLRESNEREIARSQNLEKQLKLAAAQLNQSLTDPKTDRKQREENKALRDLIHDRLREQARRKQLKELITEELNRLGIYSENLQQNLDSLAGDPLPKDFQTTETDILLNQNNQTSTLPKTGQTYAKKTPTELQAILSRDSKNYPALLQLGKIHLQNNNIDAAIVLLQKAAVQPHNDAEPHILLGYALFQKNRIDDALVSLVSGLRISPKNAEGRQYLGVLASYKGMIKRAEQEFLSAIRLNPRLAEPYFNLAILYSSAELFAPEKARQFYNKARKNGAAPDRQLEDIIEGFNENSQPYSPFLPIPN